MMLPSMYIITFDILYVGRQLQIFLLIRRVTNVDDDDDDDEGKRNESFDEEQGNTPIKSWRMKEILERGNFYSSSGTTFQILLT